MKGIILAGGRGTRLYPISKVISKQLLPIYDKPLIYYPLSILMFAGITNILIISTTEDLPRFKSLFGDGSHYGLQIEYAEQHNPNGLPEAFIIGEEFIGNDSVCMILGDNILYGHELVSIMISSVEEINQNGGAFIFCYHVNNPSQFGVVEINKKNQIISIEEKPNSPRSNFAIVGLYFCDNNVVSIAKKLKPSRRGELEIIDVLKEYMKIGLLNYEILYRGFAWLDAGSHDSMLEASHFISTIEKRQGLKIACIEEIAYRKGFIGKKQLRKLARDLGNSSYGEYLLEFLDEL